jgi:hypothetical protein
VRGRKFTQEKENKMDHNEAIKRLRNVRAELVTIDGTFNRCWDLSQHADRSIIHINEMIELLKIEENIFSQK